MNTPEVTAEHKSLVRFYRLQNKTYSLEAVEAHQAVAPRKLRWHAPASTNRV
jgi:hypothetical protein